MRKPKFTLTKKDESLAALVAMAGHVTLAVWARDCALRVLPFFTSRFPKDTRPQDALDTLQAWIESGQFNMAVIRNASLNAHAAAREVGEDAPARSAARAAGQAVATAHVRTHAMGAALYAQQTVHRAANPESALEMVAHERDWQYHRLQELISSASENQGKF